MTQHEATHRIPGWMVHRACARMVRPALASGDRARCSQPEDRRDACGPAQAKPDRGADVAVEDRAMTPAVILVVLAIALAAGGADATTKRSHAARSAFERSHPCPATGKKTQSVQRTFIGIKDMNQDGVDETVLILNSLGDTQPDA